MTTHILHWIEQVSDNCWPLLVEMAVGATLILLIAALANLLLSKSCAALRHRIWSLAALSLLVFPLLGMILPRFNFDYGNLFAASEVVQPEEIIQTEPVRYGGIAFNPYMAGSEEAYQKYLQTLPIITSTVNDSPEFNESLFLFSINAVAWREILLALWAVGTAWGIGSFAKSLLIVRRMAKNAVGCNQDVWLDAADDIGNRLGVRRKVPIAFSLDTASPLTLGWLRPVILLPVNCDNWSSEERRAVLVHEMSHIARRDVLWQNIARMTSFFYWFHPFTWLALWRMRVEHELACDDAVINFGERPSNYASLILEVAATLAGRAHRLHSGVAMAGRSKVERRIASILNPNQKRMPVGRLTSWTMIATALCIVGLSVMFIPVATVQKAKAAEDVERDINYFPADKQTTAIGGISSYGNLALADSSTEVKAKSPHNTPKTPARILNFPKDRSLGQLYVQDENYERHIDTFSYYSDEMQIQTPLGQAMGTVKVPAGKLVRLSVWSKGKLDLSPLARLDPDSIYQLNIMDMTLDDQTMLHVSKLTGLKQLHLNQSKISPRGFFYIARLKSLEQLTLPLNVTDKDMAVIGKLPNLKGFHIFFGTDHKITDDGLEILSEMPSLEEVSLGGGPITDAGLEHLKGLSKLDFLRLWGDRFTGSGLVHLKNLPALRVCSLELLPNFENDALSHLAAMPKLENLTLSRDSKISDQGMAHLANSHSLRKLDIRNTQVTPQGVASLAKVQTLEHLELPGPSLTDEALSSVSKLTNLKLLYMLLPHYNDKTKYERHYSTKGLAELDKLEKLEDLSVSGLAITDESVEHIAKHIHLKKLHISSSPLSDKGLGRLTSLKSLEELDLAFNRITIGGLSQLGELPNLKVLRTHDLLNDGQSLDIGRCTTLETLHLNMVRENAVLDKDLVCLEKLNNLKSLQLFPAAVSDEGLKHLSGLTQLYNLGIGGRNNPNIGQNITDAGFVYLSKLKKLIYLTLNGNFTGPGFQQIKDIHSLMVLELYSSQDIDPKAVEDLRRALPGVAKFDVTKRVPMANR